MVARRQWTRQWWNKFGHIRRINNRALKGRSFTFFSWQERVRPWRSVAKGAAARHSTIKDFKLEGNTLSYTQVCAGYTFSDKTTYSGDSSEGVLTTKMEGKEAITTDMKGRRLGACK
jgi:hypothetical protein